VGRLLPGQQVDAAFGNGNPRILVLPELDLAVTMLAGEYDRFEGHSERLPERVLTARRGS
jgi:hypothetical protein